MATTNVRLKDAAGNVLHPETDWSLVQNKPSISVNASSESWDRGSGTISINGNSGVSLSSNSQTVTIHAGGSVKKILVGDTNTDNKDVPLDEYPIYWKSIKGKSSGFIIFGWADSDYDEDTTDYYPAIRAYRGSRVLWTKKFNGSSWTNLDSGETFVGLDGNTH